MNISPTIESQLARIDDLNRLAWHTRVYDSPKSFELSKESVGLARRLNYQKGLADGLKTLGFCFVRVAKNEEALPLLNEAQSIFESLNDLEGLAVVYNYKAIILRNKGETGASLELAFKALELSRKIASRENEATDHYQIGVTYKVLGDFERALEHLYKSRSMFNEDNNQLLATYPINVIGAIYFENGDYPQALKYFEEGLAGRQASHDKLGEAGSLDNIGFAHLKLGNFSKAVEYCAKSFDIAEITEDKRTQSNALLHQAEVYKQTGDIEKAVLYSNRSLDIMKQIGDIRREIEMLLFLADLGKIVPGNHNVPEILSTALKMAESRKMLDLLSQSHRQLSDYYREREDYAEALRQLELHVILEKEFHKNAIAQKVQNLEITHKAEEARNETEAMRLKNEELLKTQVQLIHAEKMASLGQLTAGIAHEIQNPLNFVNNFSDLNLELLSELKEYFANGNLVEAGNIIDDLTANEVKIHYHGKRADGIVKGMLQHSRKSTGEKEPANINKLAEEYLKLSFHGLRARQKDFTARYEFIGDDKIGEINVVAQDLSRVLINLANNAFYAVHEKSRRINGVYEPTVRVTTELTSLPSGRRCVSIKILDNGDGIPGHLLEKIFQPFFTTKPAGQGTGLGLSLSYDIVKAHGGDISLNTTEGEGCEFVVRLPID